jgi:hypothetical protein
MTMRTDEHPTPSPELPDRRHRPIAVFVIGGTAKSGKTTVANYCAERLGTAAITSSSIIEPLVDAQLGLPRGTVARYRQIDRDAFRQALIETANALAERGEPPGLLCVKAGFRIVDGIRRVTELALAKAEAERLGLRPIVIFVERPGMPIVDNTESDGLRAMADVEIVNDGDVTALRTKVDAALRTIDRRQRR